MSWFRRGPRPPLELPGLSPAWQTWAGRLRDALVVVETHGSDAWLVFSAEPHVGVARLGDGFAVSSGRVPVPPEHLRYFPPSAGAWQSPHDLTATEAAQRLRRAGVLHAARPGGGDRGVRDHRRPARPGHRRRRPPLPHRPLRTGQRRTRKRSIVTGPDVRTSTGSRSTRPTAEVENRTPSPSSTGST